MELSRQGLTCAPPDLSADKLQEFLNLIENSPQTVFIRRLQIARPYKKDLVDVEMTIVSFKSRS